MIDSANTHFVEVSCMDPVSAARTARESLARGLSALQTPGAPPTLMAVADPVAQAMSALHRIEASGGGALSEAAPYALNCMRQALAMLQSPGATHPAADQAMEAIASSLGIVHQLTQVAPSPNAVSPYAGTQMMDQSLFHAPAPAPQGHAPPPAPQGHVPPPARTAAIAAQAPQAPSAYGVPPGHAAPAPYGGPAAYAATDPSGYGAPPAAPAAAAVAQPPAQSFPAGIPRVEAALGAHSPTNFYKGLSSNDIIESGGIFIATYKIPKVGSQVVVHLSLPGGYEFDALAVVRWAREAPSSGSGQRDASPGFGAQFVQISPEGRQLVYRYVRNREPLFHDDL